MLTESLWNLDADRNFMQHGCWQEFYETWILTVSLWNFDVDRIFMKTRMLTQRNTDWMDSDYLITSSGCTLSCIINLWNAYEVIKNFLSKPRFSKTFWQLDCQIAAHFPPMVLLTKKVLTFFMNSMLKHAKRRLHLKFA